jgi:hypothetical protein
MPAGPWGSSLACCLPSKCCGLTASFASFSKPKTNPLLDGIGFCFSDLRSQAKLKPRASVEPERAHPVRVPSTVAHPVSARMLTAPWRPTLFPQPALSKRTTSCPLRVLSRPTPVSNSRPRSHQASHGVGLSHSPGRTLAPPIHLHTAHRLRCHHIPAQAVNLSSNQCQFIKIGKI